MSDIHVFGSTDINDHVNFWVMPDPDYGAATASSEESVVLKGDNIQGPVTYGGFVQMRIPMMVKPTTLGDGDQTIALIGLLNAELAKPNTFVVGLDIFVGPVTFDTLISDPIPIPTDEQFAANGIATFDLVINRKSRSRRAPVTVGPTTLTTPCVIDLSAMTGEYDTLIDMLFSAPTTNDLTELWVSYVPEEYAGWCDLLSWIVEAEGLDDLSAGQWLTKATDAYANPATADNCVDVTVEAHEYAAIDTAGFPQGPYKIVSRVQVSNISDLYQVFAIAGSDIIDEMHISGNGSSSPWQVAEVGGVVLPARNVIGSAAANLEYGSRVADDTAKSYIDRLFFVPTRWGAWHWKKATSHAHTVERVGETVYADDIADLAECVGAAIEGLRGRLLIVAQGTSVTEATHAVDLTYTHTPRMTLW
jgi:hypothetical protein